MQETIKLTIAHLSQHIKRAEVSPVEILDGVLARIDEMDGKLHSYITVCREEAKQAALDAERSIRQGDNLGPLHGVPMGLKDIIATKGVRTTCGSKVFADWVPDYDATVTQRLKVAGAVIIGKHHCYEFACSPPSPFFGPATRNPWNTERDAGSSSSGTSAAIAAYLCYGGIGTDTGGSIRVPAAVTGTVGLKATYGRISRHGVFPGSWSMDHVGPMARTVEDVALMLQAIAGQDSSDPATSDVPVPNYSQALDGEVKGLRAGVPKNFFFDKADAEVQSAVRKAVEVLEGAGMDIEEVTIPRTEYILPTWLAIYASGVGAAHLPHLKAHAADYSQPVLDTVIPGLMLPAITLLKAEQARSVITREMNDLLRRVDVLLTPASPIVAWPIGDVQKAGGRLSDMMGALAPCTAPFNLTGHPSISVPCGLNSEGLPIGLQVTGRAYYEETVLQVAHAYESLAPTPRL